MTVKNKVSVKDLTKKYTMRQLQPFMLLLILVVVSLVFSCFNKNFLTLQNWSTILLASCTVGIMSIGQGVCKMADYFDLSIGMVGSMGGLVVAFLIQAGYGTIFSVIVALVLGVICGLIAGFLVVYLKMNSFVATFALQSAYRGIIMIFTDGFPIGMALNPVLKPITDFCQATIFGTIQTSVVAMIILYVLVHLFLKYTKLGRTIYLVGGNAKCAHISGISVTSVQFFIFILCDVLAVVAGVLNCGRMAAAPAFLAGTVVMESIAVSVLGGNASGHGNMLQTFISAIIIFVVKNGLIMMGIPDFYQYIAVGLIMFAAVTIQVERRGN